jgi:uncharacterized Zn-finger protein
MSDQDKIITSFLFPNETITFRPDSNLVNMEAKKLEQKLQDGKTNTCKNCFKRFSRRFNLNRHIKESCHGRQHKLACELCPATFASSALLKKHKKLNHANVCPVCAKAFNSKENLSQHAKKHLRDDYLTVTIARQFRQLARHTVSVT